MKHWFLILAFLCAVLLVRGISSSAQTYSGTYLNAETPGFKVAAYETAAAEKLTRGLKNFFLGWLEVPHGVKVRYLDRKYKGLPMGIESFFLGVFEGGIQGLRRTGVGLYEGFTFVYPQDPILEEIEEWVE